MQTAIGWLQSILVINLGAFGATGAARAARPRKAAGARAQRQPLPCDTA